MEFKDYYKILGISSAATLHDIKTAYRKLSKKFHPDINDGDKFFEERFKEIQEAYAILSDEVKKRQYDYRYSNNSKDNRYGNRDYEEYIRKKEEGFEKQKDIFKKWEESLKKKEETLKSKANSKLLKRKFGYSIFIISIISISIVVFYWLAKQNSKSDEKKYSFNVPQNDTTISATEYIPQNDTTASASQEELREVEPQPSSIQKKQTLDEGILKYELSNSKFAKIINGNWYGNAIQFDVKESWDVRFACNLKKSEFKINYPTLGCSGIWNIESVSDKSINFREYILAGKGACYNGGLVRLKILNSKKLECFFYLSNSTTLIAKGIITKQ